MRAIGSRPGLLAASAGLLGLLALSVVASVSFGAVPIPIGRVFAIVADALGLAGPDVSWNRAERNIVWELRLPRVILAAAAGAGLAAVGAVLQVLTRNPLAEPYLFGVSSGAALGAVSVILYAGAFAGALSLPVGAFLGAILALLLVFGAARGRGGTPTSERLILTGVAVAFLLQAATNFLITTSIDRGADAALFWMMGGLGTARWSTVPVPVAATCLGLTWLLLRAPVVNALAFGDDTARTLGIDPRRLRVEMFVVTALMTGAIVSASGGIGFVGLVMPHIVRLFVGGDLRRLLPLCSLLGALFLVWIDVLSRTAFAPREIPLGVMTAVVGGIFFLWLIRRRPAP